MLWWAPSMTDLPPLVHRHNDEGIVMRTIALALDTSLLADEAVNDCGKTKVPVQPANWPATTCWHILGCASVFHHICITSHWYHHHPPVWYLYHLHIHQCNGTHGSQHICIQTWITTATSSVSRRLNLIRLWSIGSLLCILWDSMETIQCHGP